MSEFGEFLRDLRGKRSLREMERLTGLSHTYLSSLEKGVDPRSGRERKPTPEALKQISDALPEVDYMELMRLAGYVQTVGEIIKNEREAAGLTIKQLSDRCGLSVEDLETIENYSPEFKVPQLVFARVMICINQSIPKEMKTLLIHENSSLGYLDINKMTSEQRKEFGQTFKETRLSQNISLEVIALKTNIPISDLIALEDGKLNRSLSLKEYTSILNNFKLFDNYLITKNSDFELMQLILLDERVNFKGKSLNEEERKKIYNYILQVMQ